MNIRKKKKLFAQEYPALFDDVYRYVRYRIRSREEAEDIVSNAFLKAYARLAEYRPELGNLRQWLTGIAKYELLMHWRSKRHECSLEITESLVQGTDDPTQDIDQHVLTEIIFKSLSADMKALVAMRYADGLTYEELAEITQKDAAALRQTFSRLHRSLRLEFRDIHE